MKKRMILRSDDLGYSRGVNYGIYESVANGIIRNVGLMSNMTDARHGIQLLENFDLSLGLHTNICLGKPVAAPEKVPSLLDENGNFKRSSDYWKAYQTGKEISDLNEIIIEIEAQYQQFVTIVGKKPAYFEAHAVQSNHLLTAMEVVAKQYDLPLMQTDLAENVIKFRHKKLISHMESMLPEYNPFQLLKNVASKDFKSDEIGMIIFHPGYIDEFLWQNSSLTLPRIVETAMLTSAEVKKWVINNDIDLIKVDELTKEG